MWSDGKKQNVTEAVGGWSAAQQPSAIVQLVESGPAVAKGDLKQLGTTSETTTVLYISLVD